MINNKIITRGMGSSRNVYGRAGLITQGFGGIFEAVVEQIGRILVKGRSAAKKRIEEIQVSVQLILVNGRRVHGLKGVSRVSLSIFTTAYIKAVNLLNTAIKRINVLVRRL